MEAQIIRIGNSKGLRIPSTILKQCKLKDIVSLEVVNDRLIISPSSNSRLDWEQYFKSLPQNANNQLMDEDYLSNSFDDEEWEW